jgi:NAD(P)-dependent dehydrogenase (short-subunit alcohol dehydrogenase family)
MLERRAAVVRMCGRQQQYGKPADGGQQSLVSHARLPLAHAGTERGGGLFRSGRQAEISDIADAVLYLGSAPIVTGESLHVDGGQSAGH